MFGLRACLPHGENRREQGGPITTLNLEEEGAYKLPSLELGGQGEPGE